MSQSLDYYKNNDRVFSVSGYTFNLSSMDRINYDVYLLRIFPLLLVVIPIQILGYGIGFLQAFIRRFMLNESELTGFKKNYYK